MGSALLQRSGQGDRSWARRILRALPQGRGLPRADWERRHRGLLAVLWLHVVAVPAFGLAQGYAPGHVALEGMALVAAAVAAQFAPLSQRLRSAAVCVGLLTSSGMLVHFSGGYIEFHFHFFVMIALLGLYVDWFPFLLAVGYVLGHHGLVGVLASTAVYNHPDAIAHPWKWAGIHAGFVLAAGAASIYTWRISEEELRRRTNIARVTEAALAKLPLGELLDELLARISEVVDAEIASIWLREDDGLVLRSVHGGWEPMKERVRLSSDDGFHSRIVAGGGPAVLTDVDPETIENQLHRSNGVRALAGVPLIVEGALVGVLDVASRHPRQFSSAELELLQLVADRIGPAIDRARLYEQEHRIATTLQRSLLPKRLPDVPGVALAARYIPAGDSVSVGGDWYDAMELPGGRVALVLGDVAGHGSEAAALMGQLRTGLRAYATEGHGPDAVVGRLNSLLFGLDDESLATLLYLELDLTTWTIRMVNAGHPPPLLLDPVGRCGLMEGPRGAPLGVGPFTAYTSKDFEVEPGTSLVLYTDGLVERRGTALSASLDELARQVAASDARDANALCDEIVEISRADGPLADDVAVLVLQRGLSAPLAFAVQHPAEPSAIPAIRQRLEHFLRSVGASPEEIYEIVTSGCEACANAIQHAYGAQDATFSLAGELNEDGAVELRVTDSGHWRTPVVSDGGGRGLVLMRALMDDVDVNPSDSGTQVTLTRRLNRVREGIVGRT